MRDTTTISFSPLVAQPEGRAKTHEKQLCLLCSEEAGIQTETNPAEETTAQRKSALLPPCIVIYLVKYIY